MRVFLAIGVILLINAQFQVNSLSLPQKEEGTTSNFEEWLTDNALDLFNSLNDLDTETNSKVQHIDNQWDTKNSVDYTTLLGHDSWQQLIKPEFYQQNLKQVNNLKKINISDLIHCDRLSQALLDVGEIFQKSMNITMVFGDNVNEAVKGIKNCREHKRIKKVWCIIKVIFKAGKDVSSNWPHFMAYIKEVQGLAKDIREIYDYCNQRKYNISVALVEKND